MSSTSPDPTELRLGDGERVAGTWALVGSLAVTHVVTALVHAERAQVGLVGALFLERSVRLRVTVGGQYGPLVWDGQIWRLVRSVWLHADALHLLVNALALWVLGRLLEPWIGSIRLWWWFALAGVGGSIASQLAGLTQSDGASGGAFGLLGALLVLAWRHRDQLDPDDRRIAMRWLPGFLVLNIVLSLVLPFVDAIGHLGGLGVGLLCGAMAAPRPPGRAIRTLEALGVGVLGAIALGGPWIP